MNNTEKPTGLGRQLLAAVRSWNIERKIAKIEDRINGLEALNQYWGNMGAVGTGGLPLSIVDAAAARTSKLAVLRGRLERLKKLRDGK